MIITAISDLHGNYPELEGGDLLIVAGDLTRSGQYGEYIEFCQWLEECDYEKIIVIGGNHDNALVPGYGGVEFGFDFSGWATYLCDSGTEFEGIKIWGSPWTKTFPNMNPKCKAFTYETEEELAEKWTLIPDDIDILITHSPPYLIGDLVQKSPYPEEHVGSKSLGKKIKKSKINLHVFGHIHTGYGETRLQRIKDGHEFIFVNASHVNERYQPVNKPIRITL